jgi:hypothetical protein
MAMPQRGIEFPGQATFDRPERLPGDEVDDVIVLAGLLGRQAKARERFIQCWVDPVRARLAVRWPTGTIRRIDRRVDDHGARKPIAMARACEDRRKASKRVGHKHWWLGIVEHAGICGDSHLFLDEEVHRIAAAVAGVAHSRQVECGDVVLACEEGSDEAPPVGMRAIAVDEKKTRLGAVAPAHVMNPCIRDPDLATFAWRCDCPLEPVRSDNALAVEAGQRPKP